MKLTVTTTYTNMSQTDIAWYLTRLRTSDVLPGSTKIADELEKTGFASFSSSDPTSKMHGETTYRIENE